MSGREWWEEALPGEVPEKPWMHADAIHYMKGLLKPSFRVLEHGSGGSTLWFARMVAEVVSLEWRPGWAEVISNNAPENATVHLQENGVIAGYVGSGYDLLLIDGNPPEDRALYLDAAENLVKPGGYVVLDNANRPEYADARLRFIGKAKLLKHIDRNIWRSKYFVTEFYQLPKRRKVKADAKGNEPAEALGRPAQAA